VLKVTQEATRQALTDALLKHPSIES